MIPPDQDIEARQPIWDCMQMFWMDIDPMDEVEGTAKICASSKYSMDELKAIFLNEVRPAVSFNLYSGVAPEWTGFNIEWLTQRILQSNKFNKRLPRKWLNKYSYNWWSILETAISQERSKLPSFKRT